MKNVKVKCPECGFEFNHKADDNETANIIYCPLDEGGCDKQFAIEIETQYIATIFKITEAKE